MENRHDRAARGPPGHRHRRAGLAAVRAARCWAPSCCCSPAGARTAGVTGSGSPPSPAAFVVGLLIFFDTLALAPEQRTRELSLYRWFAVGGLDVDFGLRLDPLSLTFVLLITGVGALIHLYSVGYMAHDPGRRRFFGQLNLFVTAMLLLVLGNNFVMLYLGWEGVGLASYLLIGWYQDRPSAATAAKKAFLMNRVGDVGLAIAIFLLWTNLGTLQYTEVFERVGELSGGRAAGDHAAAAARRLRQVRPVPAAGLAPGRDGGPDPGLRAHPRGDDGHRRRLPHRPREPDLRPDRHRTRWSSRSSARSRC